MKITAEQKNAGGEVDIVFLAETPEDEVNLKRAVIQAMSAGALVACSDDGEVHVNGLGRELPLRILDELEKLGYGDDEVRDADSR